LGPDGQVVGAQDQRHKIRNIQHRAVWTRLIVPTLFQFGRLRPKTNTITIPAATRFADLTPGCGSNRCQDRGHNTDTSDIPREGITTSKRALFMSRPFLRKKNRLGIVDPTFNLFA